MNPKSILLINPWIYDFAAYDFWIKPLGLLTLAAILRKNGFPVNVIDCLNPWHDPSKTSSPTGAFKGTSLGTGEFPKTHIPKPEFFSSFPRKTAGKLTPDQFLRHGDEHLRRTDQERVVIKREIHNTVLFIPELDFFNNSIWISPDEERI